MAVEYAKYKCCILDVFDSPMFEPFEAIIQEEFKQNKAYLSRRLEAAIKSKYTVTTPYDRIICDYDMMMAKFKKVS